MSTTTTADTHGHGSHGDGHADAHGHAHDPHLAHHFDTPAQQFSTGKLGMWTFLATEVLMFGGLFCAYAVYRSNHPEVYLWAHRALDPTWGMINTIVLLASSFTMAWGVRAAQLNQKGLLQIMLALTFVGGVGFMCIKAVEYNQKWKHFLFPGEFNAFNSTFKPEGKDALEAKRQTIQYIESHGSGAHGADSHGDAGHGAKDMHDAGPNVTASHDAKPNAVNSAPGAHGSHDSTATAASQPSTQPVAQTNNEPTSRQPVRNARVEPSVVGVVALDTHFHDGNAGNSDAATILPPAFAPAGTNLAADEKVGHHYKSYDELDPEDRQTLNAFFSIYFMMTGLHGIHVVVGMGLIAWLFMRASAGEFSEKYFTPVDLGGLYWHLVDLIWIFLFPLLYLIH